MAKVSEKVVNEFKTVQNTKFDEEKTRQLIEEIREQGMDVSVENLAQYIRTQGLIVKVHVGGGKSVYELSPKAYGIDEDNLGSETKELLAKHVKRSKISLLPNTYSKKLENLESNLRMQCRRNSIGYDNSFMPMETYKEFVEFFKETQKEYMAVRDEIMDKYDFLVKRFKEITRISLEELNAIDLEGQYNKIVGRFGGEPGDPAYEKFKEKYKNSFYMSLSVKAFPVTENLDMFEDDIKRQIQDGLNQETVQTLYEIIGNALNDAFTSVAKIINSAQKNDGKVAPRTLGSIDDCIKRVKQKNIFANAKINSIIQDVEVMMANSSDSDILLQNAEIVLSKIYSYAVDLQIGYLISLKDSPLSADVLLEIAETIKEDNDNIDVIVQEENIVPALEELF